MILTPRRILFSIPPAVRGWWPMSGKTGSYWQRATRGALGDLEVILKRDIIL